MQTKEPIEIAIIEDQQTYGQTLKEFINETSGLHCSRVYANGESAIQDVPKRSLDIILVDIGLPGISGIECIRQLKEQIPKIQFMVITISEDDEKVFAALAAGAASYLLKGTGMAKIAESIKELYDGGSPMSAPIARKLVHFFQQSTKLRKNPNIDLLTKREKEVLELLAKGLMYKQIAVKLFISLETVKSHCHNIYEKLHVSNKTEAVIKYYKKTQ